MNLEQYKAKREKLTAAMPKYRHLCLACMQPEFGCYCEHIQKFDPKIKFVILIHPIEMKRRIATGRMSHLCLQGSELIMGQDYSEDSAVNQIIKDPRHHCAVLYPGLQASNLTEFSNERRAALIPIEKTPVLFIIDGTWATARKTMHLSQNLKALPRFCFTPPAQSQFQVRKQPGVECFSTIEAIHHVIDLLGEGVGFDLATGQHNGLMTVFKKMVQRQLQFVKDAFEHPRPTSYRRPRNWLPKSSIEKASGVEPEAFVSL